MNFNVFGRSPDFSCLHEVHICGLQWNALTARFPQVLKVCKSLWIWKKIKPLKVFENRHTYVFQPLSDLLCAVSWIPPLCCSVLVFSQSDWWLSSCQSSCWQICWKQKAQAKSTWNRLRSMSIQEHHFHTMFSKCWFVSGKVSVAEWIDFFFIEVKYVSKLALMGVEWHTWYVCEVCDLCEVSNAK